MKKTLLATIATAGVIITGTVLPTSAAHADEVELPAADILNVDFRDGTATDHALGAQAITWGEPTITNDATLGKDVFIADGDDAIGYPVADATYGAMSESVTVECVFRFDGDLPTSGEQNMCANKEAGGFAMVVNGSTMRFMIHVGGGYKTVSAPVAADRWYHTASVWDGSTLTLYVDGVAVHSIAAEGAFKLPNAGARNLLLGADSAPSDGAQFYGHTTVSSARVYSQPFTADQASAAYLASELIVPAPAADILDVDFSDGTPTDAAQGLTPTTWGSPIISQSEQVNKAVATFDGADDAYSYPFANEYGKLENALTVECTFRYNGSLPVGSETNLCANKEAGGFATVIYAPDDISFIAHIGGSYKTIRTPLVSGQWYHTVGVWDGTSLRFYVNGELAGEMPATGAMKPPTDASHHFTIGADSGPRNAPQFYAASTVSSARVYSAALTAPQVLDRYNTEIGPLLDRPVSIAATVPANGDRLLSPVNFSIAFQNEALLAPGARFTLDGEPIEVGDRIGEGMREGAHTIEVDATDVFGNPVTGAIEFTSTNIPDSGGTETGQEGGSVTLSANATNPSGGEVTTTFKRADAFVPDGGVQGVLNDLPATLEFEYTEGEELEGTVRPDDDDSIDTISTTGIPFQRFDVALDGAAAGTTIMWSGQIDPARFATLWAWNTTTGGWETVASSRGKADAKLTLAGEGKDDYLDGGVVHVMVTGQDAFADDLNEPVKDSFDDPSTYDFSMAHFTDTQYLAEGAVEATTAEERALWQEAYDAIPRWIVENAEERKIAYAAHTGDVIENWHTGGPVADEAAYETIARQEFEVASNAQRILEDAGIVNSILPGNHDNRTGSDNGAGNLFNEYFGPERYQAQAATPAWQEFGAEYYPWKEGDNDNSYTLFSAGGLDFITVSLGYSVTDEEVAWANSVLEQYRDRNAFVLTHAYNKPSYNPDGRGAQFSVDGSKLLNGVLAQNPNVFMVLSGHEHGVSIELKRDVGTVGNHVVELLADYQFYLVSAEELGLTGVGGRAGTDLLRFGSSFMRLLQFDVDKSEVSIDTYSPLLDNFGATEYDDEQRYNGTEDDLRLPIQLETRKTSFSTDTVVVIAPTDEVVGVDTARSGWPASVVWSGLNEGEVYGWEAVSVDTGNGEELVPGGIVQRAAFTATAAGTDVTPPVITLPEGITQVELGAAFDPLEGVTAIDNTDGDVTASIEVVGTVDTSVPGIYTLSYSVRDTNGNQAIASRAVAVATEVPGEPGPGEPGPGEPPIADVELSLSSGEVRAGGSVTVTGSGFLSNQAFAVELHSTPVSLGSFQADAAGVAAFSVTIPANTAPGAHSLVILAAGETLAAADLTVTPAPAGGGETPGGETPIGPGAGPIAGDPAGNADGSLADTGASDATPFVAGAAMLLLLAGLAIAVIARRARADRS